MRSYKKLRRNVKKMKKYAKNEKYAKMEQKCKKRKLKCVTSLKNNNNNALPGEHAR